MSRFVVANSERLDSLTEPRPALRRALPAAPAQNDLVVRPRKAVEDPMLHPMHRAQPEVARVLPNIGTHETCAGAAWHIDEKGRPHLHSAIKIGSRLHRRSLAGTREEPAPRLRKDAPAGRLSVMPKR